MVWDLEVQGDLWVLEICLAVLLVVFMIWVILA
jgi:hypothetical protein